MDDKEALLRDLRRKNTLVTSLQDRIARLEDVARSQHTAVREAQRQAADARQVVEQHEARVTSYRRKYYDAIQTIKSQQVALESLEAQLRERDQQFEALQRKYARSKSQRAALQQQVQQQEHHLQEAAQQRQQAEQELQAVRRREQDQVAALQSKTELVDTLETTIQTLEIEVKDRDRAIRHLKRQLKQQPSEPPLMSSSRAQNDTNHRLFPIPSRIFENDSTEIEYSTKPRAPTISPQTNRWLLDGDDVSVTIQAAARPSRSPLHQQRQTKPVQSSSYRTKPFSPSAATLKSANTLTTKTASQDAAALEAVLDEHIQRFERGLHITRP